MPIYLKQSTASQEIPLGYFLDSSDGDTAEDGLTIANTDIKIWKTGATTLADKNSGGATHIAGGIYYAVLDATDTDTLGPMVIFCHVSGALAVRVECVVLAANVYDSLIAASDQLQVDAIQISGDATAADNAELMFDGTGYAGGTTKLGVDVVAISGDTAAADNAELDYDGTGYNKTNSTVGTATTIGATGLAAINAEVVDTLTTDTYAEPAGVPAATSTLKDKINWLFILARNKVTSTSTTITVRNDADGADVATSTQSDDSTTYTRGEWT